MANELGAPLLGRKARREAARQRGFHLPVARLTLAALVVIAGVVTLFIVLTDNPNGGRPTAEVAIASPPDDNAIASSVAAPAGPGMPATITADPEEIEVPGGPQITTLADDSVAADQAALAASAAGVLPDLVEETADGPLPRIAADGRTPFASYGNPTPASAIGGRIPIAIIVTGLGLNEQGTLDAVARLPQAVTLAFAPYSKTLDRTTAAARGTGHELFLEIPLEPFDYPDNDPGPETLLTGQPPRSNLEKVYWLLSRFGGYAGVINYMGARFTASAADFSPVMEELGTRGLGYLDDGSSNRSLAPQLAATNGVPFGKAELMLDGDPSRTGILKQLEDLERRATANGGAIGLVSALPVSVDTITEWAMGLEDRGFILVPATTLMGGK